ncbi:hypothetical protein SpCBS45565_g01021 [Spizellomyces sp. 'palustris']|nr:hypothetical protein SpCBS45565_g01021 [Spizellomyces sp. 'palustris']
MDLLRKIVRSNAAPGRRKERAHDAFALAEISRLGIPGYPTAIAHDPAQSLLAVGTSVGSVVIVGKGWEYALFAPEGYSSAIRFLAFKVGDKYVVGVTAKSDLLVWDLQAKKLKLPPVPVYGNVSSLNVPSQSKWIYLGCCNGTVIVYDCTTGKQSPYTITYPFYADEESRGEENERQIQVTGLETNPTDLNLLLIGYASGFVALWDLKEQLLRRKFRMQLADGDGPLQAVCWHPDGLYFMANFGRRSAIWELKEGWLDGLKKNTIHKPVRIIETTPVSIPPTQDPGKPFSRKIIWMRGTTTDESLLIMTGVKEEGESLAVRRLSRCTNMANMKSDVMHAIGMDAVDFALVGDDKGKHRLAIVVVTSSRTVEAFYLGQEERLTLSGSVTISSAPSIIDFTYSDCPEALGWEMRGGATPPEDPRTLPMHGGTLINKNAKYVWDVFCTLHADKVIRFWQVGIPSPRLLFTLSPEKVTGDLSQVTMDLDQRALLLTAGCTVTMYRWFSASEISAAKAANGPLEDMDTLMQRLDETVDQVLKQSEDIQRLSRASDSLHVAADGPEIPQGQETKHDGGKTSEQEEGPPRPLSKHSSAGDSQGVGETDSKTGTDNGVDPAPAVDATPADQTSAPTVSLETSGDGQNAEGSPTGSDDQQAEEEGLVSGNTSPKKVSEVNLPAPEQPPALPQRLSSHDPLAAENESLVGNSQHADFRDSVLVKDSFPFEAQETELRDSLTSNDYVTLETILPEEPPEKPSWQPMVQAVHKDPVRLQAFASWAELLVTATEGGRLHVVQLSTGREVTVEPLYGESRENSEVVEFDLLHVADTYFDKETIPRTCIFALSAAGLQLVYGVYTDIVTGDLTLKKWVLFDRRRTIQQPVLLTVVDDHGRIVRQARNSHHNGTSNQTGENYIIAALSRTIVVYIVEPGTKPAVAAIINPSDENGPILKASLSFLHGDPVLIVVTGAGLIQAFELPGLKLLWENRLPIGNLDESRLRKTCIAKDGKTLCWTWEREFRMFSIISDKSNLPDLETRIYDLTRATSWARAHGVRLSSASSNKEHDALFRPLPMIEPVGSLSGEEGSAFGHAKRALDERGEKLGQLEHKFGDLADSSKNFLDTIKDYNERQAQKKW